MAERGWLLGPTDSIGTQSWAEGKANKGNKNRLPSLEPRVSSWGCVTPMANEPACYSGTWSA